MTLGKGAYVLRTQAVHNAYVHRGTVGVFDGRSPGPEPGPRHTERQRPRIKSGAAWHLIRGLCISLGAAWVSPTLRADAPVGRGLPRHATSCGAGVSGRTPTYAAAPVGRGSPRQCWRCPSPNTPLGIAGQRPTSPRRALLRRRCCYDRFVI